jgi:pilus assembly protein CpaE
MHLAYLRGAPPSANKFSIGYNAFLSAADNSNETSLSFLGLQTLNALEHATGSSNLAMSSAIQIPVPLISAGGLSIAVISPDEQRRGAATIALGEYQNGTIREFICYPPDLNDVSHTLGNNFDVIFVDLDSDPEYALDLVESICSHDLATAIVYSVQADPDLLVRCIRAGAREYLMLPFDREEISEALVRASALRLALRPSKKTNGRLLVFLSAKGGSGATTLACNFAVSLAQESRQKTLLIDLNLPLGDAAINLGIKAEYTIVTAFQNSSRLDSQLLSGLLVQHSSGLFVLAAPSELAPTFVSAEVIDKLLEVACQDFDYVVVDAGSRLDMQRKHLSDESATVYLVTQVGIPELRNSHRLIVQLSAKGSPKLEIVINRFDPYSTEIDEAHIAKALNRPVTWKIPNNYAAVRQMQNTATPLTDEDSQISRSIQRVSRSVCGKPAIPETKKKFSLFG